jgi:hypothetical protein
MERHAGSATAKIVRVTFTCQAPEYWRAVAFMKPDKVVEPYQKFVSPAANKAQLLPNGQRRRDNHIAGRNRDQVVGVLSSVERIVLLNTRDSQYQNFA